MFNATVDEYRDAYDNDDSEDNKDKDENETPLFRNTVKIKDTLCRTEDKGCFAIMDNHKKHHCTRLTGDYNDNTYNRGQ